MKLTRRESEVLAYLVDGARADVIAAELFISPGTVSDHIKAILRKTETHSRAEVALNVLRAENARLRALLPNGVYVDSSCSEAPADHHGD